jgi:hypothetical protein
VVAQQDRRSIISAQAGVQVDSGLLHKFRFQKPFFDPLNAVSSSVTVSIIVVW